MNPVDLVVCLILVFAAWRGWRRGVVMQACSLVGIAAGIWLAAHNAARAGEWLGLEGDAAVPGGFAAIFVGALVAVGIAGRLLGGLFRFAGLGLPDRLLGAGASVVGYALALSVLFSSFAPFVDDWAPATRRTLESSLVWEPLCGLSERLLPVLDRARGRFGGEGQREPEKTQEI